jgi:7-keto-8-aminopelargonate synthetase-like enzyme
LNSRYAALQQQLIQLEEKNLRRKLKTLTPLSATRGLVAGKELLLLCSNDYLGLSAHPELQAAFHKGSGAGASRLISGNRPAHQALEEALSIHFNRPATLFGSGYLANLALPSLLVQPGEAVASDALNHASMVDGIRLCKGERRILAHGSPEGAETARLLMLEGLYSMDGDSPDFARYPHDPWWLVDEAHAVGCLGPNGKGAAAEAGFEPDFLVGTLGKAYGAAGAFVVGPSELRELIISKGRSFIYSTGLPEPVCWAALAGLRLATSERRQKLACNARLLRGFLKELGIPALGKAHIVPILTGPKTVQIAERLLKQGIWAPPIRYPTVPQGQERIRLTVCSEHSERDLEQAASALELALKG